MSRQLLLRAIHAGLDKSGFTPYELNLLINVAVIVRPHRCSVVGFGPEAVNVVGDARAYVPSVIVSFPPGMEWDEIGRISTDVTNRVRVSRVLIHIKP